MPDFQPAVVVAGRQQQYFQEQEQQKQQAALPELPLPLAHKYAAEASACLACPPAST